MNQQLTKLSLELELFSRGIHNSSTLFEIEKIIKAKQDVIRVHGGAAIEVKSSTIMTAIAEFRDQKVITNFRNLKYICLGMCMLTENNTYSILNTELRKILFKTIHAETNIRKRLKCFQALLFSFWIYPLNIETQNKTSQNIIIETWHELQKWLLQEYQQIFKILDAQPPWFSSLTKHIQLLNMNPCEHFGKALLNGDAKDLLDAKESLSLPSTSWVFEEVILEQIHAGCNLPDNNFKDFLLRLINLCTESNDINLVNSLKKRSIAKLVLRYSKCKDNSEFIPLRDAAVGIIGNPWLHRLNWDVSVVDDSGAPDENSREMINSWLKKRLITDFFELLSADGVGDRRRLEYWLNFEPLIDDMWFVLGNNAIHRSSALFIDFRKRAKGRLLRLGGSNAENNAFVMKVGSYLFVEFGATGNAMFVLSWTGLEQNLLLQFKNSTSSEIVHIKQLKPTSNIKRLIHTDNQFRSWEEKFDLELSPIISLNRNINLTQIPLLNSIEETQFSIEKFKNFALKNHLLIEDNLSINGALWVYDVEQEHKVSTQLAAWGFMKREPKGWYKI